VPQPDASSGVHVIDWLIVGGYFAFVIWLGSRFGKKQTSSTRYFLGNRNLPGWAIGMSLFATIISSWTFLAIPGKSFKTDMQYILTITPIPLIVLIAVFFVIPLFRNRIKMSAYEYLERRFGLAARFYGNIIFIMSHFFKMGMVLYLLCLAIEGATGWGEQYLIYIIIVVGITTITYTFFGGIEGVIWTDVIQGFLLLGGGLVGLLFLLFAHKTGPAEVLNMAWDAEKFKLATFDLYACHAWFYSLSCQIHYRPDGYTALSSGAIVKAGITVTLDFGYVTWIGLGDIHDRRCLAVVVLQCSFGSATARRSSQARSGVRLFHRSSTARWYRGIDTCRDFRRLDVNTKF
jgi:Na+/proline symporter